MAPPASNSTSSTDIHLQLPWGSCHKLSGLAFLFPCSRLTLAFLGLGSVKWEVPVSPACLRVSYVSPTALNGQSGKEQDVFLNIQVYLPLNCEIKPE